jgi:menaquinone-9 beta-reductase
VQDRERVSRSRFTVNGDQYSAPRHKRFEYAPVVSLESYAPHGAGQPELPKVVPLTLKGRNERAARERRSDRGQLEAIRRAIEDPREQRADVGALPAENRQRFGNEPCLRQRLQPFLGPRDVLKHSNRESPCFNIDHTLCNVREKASATNPVTFTDIAIAGAGPAGAWAAYSLASRGARVAIFDPSHPREKPCGGGVTGRALAVVGEGVAEASRPASAIRRARFLAPTGRSAVVPLQTNGADETALVVVSRAAFDAAILRAACQAGATLVDARITDVKLEPSGPRIETTRGAYRTRFLIGADGANSLVRRRLARAFSREDLSIATGYFAHGVTSDEVLIELITDPPGYIWSFPRSTHLAIGICAQADAGLTAAALRAKAAAWIDATRIAEGARLEPYSWPIPSLSVERLRGLELAGPNWCVAGDAAGLVDPITREGIYFALLSGQWAADAAIAGDASQYTARVRAAIVPELERAARLKAWFFRLGSTDLLIQALQRSDAVNAIMANLISGRQGYAGLKWRLLQTMEWRLAWQILVSARNTRHVPEHARPASKR